MEKCILIYEDDLEILELCKILLSGPGRRVETLTRCEHILSDIAQLKPDLILMDLWIPEIGGEKAVSLIKENAGNDHIAVILFSANNSIEDICKKVKADGFLKKPFDIASLNEIADKYLYGHNN